MGRTLLSEGGEMNDTMEMFELRLYVWSRDSA